MGRACAENASTQLVDGKRDSAKACNVHIGDGFPTQQCDLGINPSKGADWLTRWDLRRNVLRS